MSLNAFILNDFLNGSYSFYRVVTHLSEKLKTFLKMSSWFHFQKKFPAHRLKRVT
jgi:hypothetical protein